MPMQFIVNQMTGNAPVTYYPQVSEPQPKPRRARQSRPPIPDEAIRKAASMRNRGLTWAAIGARIGRSGQGIAVAVKRKGLI